MLDIKRTDYTLTTDDVDHLNSLSPDIRELVKGALENTASTLNGTASILAAEPEKTEHVEAVIENRRALASV